MAEALKRLERLTLNWWFGDGLLLTLALFVVVTAAFLNPSSEAVSFFGQDVPVLCGWRRMTGIPCLGCGLTRSFTYMAHGQVVEAFRMNFLGPIFFGVVLSQVPWRAFKLWRGRPGVDAS